MSKLYSNSTGTKLKDIKMAYVLVYNGTVINGPRDWNYRSFESSLLEECNIDYKLPMSYNDPRPVEIEEGVRILSATQIFQEYNPKIEYLHGPFWSFDNDVATGTYEIVQHTPEAAMGGLIGQVAANRYVKEIQGIKVTVQDIELSISTDRGVRDQWSLWVGQGVDAVPYKFGSGWLTLSSADIKTIADSVHAHVQAQFAWERSKIEEIKNCTTLEALDAVVLE
jgi:hypothetical protein